MKSKFNFAIEIVWLTVAILSIIAGVHKTYQTNLNESYPFFIITAISTFIYLIRRYFRLSSKNKTE